MIRITFTILCLLILVPSAFAQNRDTVFNDPVYPFSLSFPQSWKSTGRSDSQIRLEVISDYGNGLANFVVAVSPAKGSEKVPASTFVKLMLDDRPDLLQVIVDGAVRNGKIVEKGRTYLANKDALYVIYEGEYRTPSDTFFVKTYFIETLFEGNVYAITFTTSKEGFPRSHETFKDIASNFGLIPTKISVPKKP